MAEVSVFDIIGPIMVGPSSSHTAGAVRLALMARALLGAQPARAVIGLHGSFAHTGKGHGTDRALVGGLLGFAPDDDRIRASLAIAAAQGVQVSFEQTDLGGDAHPNSAVFELWDDGDRHVRCAGASIGGGMIRITEIEGYRVDFSGQYHTLIVVAEDRPGTINSVTSWFLHYGLNIAFFKVTRRERGGEAIMIVESDDDLPEVLPEAVADFPWVRWARFVPKLDS